MSKANLRLSIAALTVAVITVLSIIVVNVAEARAAKKYKAGDESCEACYVTNWKVNLRKGPGDGHRLIGVIPKSNFIMCLKIRTNKGGQVWLYVEWLTKKGRLRKGYVKYSEKALSLVDCPM